VAVVAAAAITRLVASRVSRMAAAAAADSVEAAVRVVITRPQRLRVTPRLEGSKLLQQPAPLAVMAAVVTVEAVTTTVADGVEMAVAATRRQPAQRRQMQPRTTPMQMKTMLLRPASRALAAVA